MVLQVVRRGATMGAMDKHVVSMISLGCAKNLVDSEGVLGALVESGWLVAARPNDADVLLINTCGFIEDARSESLNVIEEALKLKEAGVVPAVVVMGCMVQLMREPLLSQFAGVDGWVGVAAPALVADACEKALSNAALQQAEGGVKQSGASLQKVVWLPDPSVRAIDGGPRLRITPKHYAYLRIAEGCDNRCHYCQIPSIRGPLRSKPVEAVLTEARELVADGAREIIVIAQDTTGYGTDLYGEQRLTALLRQLRDVDGVQWLRLLYTHPAHFGDDLVAVLAEGGALLPYVDLPIQHASDAILERMGRKTGRAGLEQVIRRIRAAVPEAVIRTSVIVGFPGEGDAEFSDLFDFVKEMRFERLGAFAYSCEAGTPAAGLDGQVPAEVKEERLAAIMELQQEIATEQSDALIGREIDVVVDGKGGDGEWAGRTVRDAPDVDGSIKFDETNLRPGLFARATVTDAYGYDLIGTLVQSDGEDFLVESTE